ncbi:MAG: hypothetical protein A2078_13205 [Nitrospirae bacterium GWC2_57_9]|nr:MAG: hypothetical protein A2078_13205 [Nitrospirae bacterium GWC2_57_9]
MKTVLIVDDNPDGILLTQIALSELVLDIRTETADSGENALRLLADAPDLPALILLDLKMPGIGGIETLRRIRADDRLKHIPVVIVTLSTLESDEVTARETGANGFVRKAIRNEEFSRDLEQQVRLYVKS